MVKAKAASSGTSRVTAPPSVRRKEAAPAATDAGRAETPDPRKMMREAAWRQMFGKAQSKSPFGR